MQLLILWFTDAESGAPGYLSKRGELAADAMAGDLFSFCVDALKIDLGDGWENRADALASDLRFRLLKNEPQSAAARTAARAMSAALFSSVTLFSGSHPNLLNTAALVGQKFALPICVDTRLDLNLTTNTQSKINLTQKEKNELAAEEQLFRGAIESFLREFSADPQAPKVLLLGCTKVYLQNFVSMFLQGVSEKSTIAKALNDNNHTNPIVFASGLEVTPTHLNWTFDDEVKEHENSSTL